MNKVTIRASEGKETISRHIYGHFSEHLGHCIYGGYWVGESSSIPNTRGIRNDVVQALRKIGIPNLRWPGGCFADEYHWHDGIGPREERPSMVNTHWGGVTENNHFGTHEYMDLCSQLGCEPYICGNVGSGTVQEMQQWVEYITHDGISPMSNLRRGNGREQPWRLKYWGVGNENWGCGGSMRPEYYADEYRRYQTYVRNFGENRIFKIACGPNAADYNWTEVLMRETKRGDRYLMDGLAWHYYIPYGPKRKLISATHFQEDEWILMLESAHNTENLLSHHVEIMDKDDPEKKVALIVDEWGTWYRVEPGTNPGFLYQQNTLRDALAAGVTLNIFNNHCDRVRMTNIAQTVNVLQAMILTDDEKMLLTPSYHIYDLYKVHHDATLLPVELESDKYEYAGLSMPALSVSASRDQAGRVHITLCNSDPRNALDVECVLEGQSVLSVSGQVITADEMNALNTFEEPDRLRPVRFNGAAVKGGRLVVAMPAKSVVALELR